MKKILYKYEKIKNSKGNLVAGNLAAIKLEFNNGASSGWIENTRYNSPHGLSDIKTIQINSLVTISKIAMKVDKTNQGFEGIRLYRSDGTKEVDVTWKESSGRVETGAWKTQTIPSGEYIIGVKASHTTNRNESSILLRLGW